MMKTSAAPLSALVALLIGGLLVSVPGACRDGAAPVVAERPVRICSATLAGDEILADLVAPERVVAVTRFVDDVRLSNVVGHYPPAVPRIRDANGEFERLVAMGPDLVLLSPHNDAEFLELMRATGLNALTIEAHRSLVDVQRAYAAVGDAVGEEDRAGAVVRWMSEGLEALDDALADVQQHPRVLFWAGGFTAGGNTTVGDLIARAGGINVAVELGITRSEEVDSERVVAANPDFLLRSRWDITEEAGYTDFPPAFRELAAVREGRVIEIDGRLLDVLSSHLVEGAWRLAKHLHPDRIDDRALARIAQGPPPR